MFSSYYSLNSFSELQSFTNVYLPLVESMLLKFNIALFEDELKGDHLGVQVLSSDEFDYVDRALSKYSKVTHRGMIHNRRNNVYKLNISLKYKDIEIGLIEIFEPKPEADIKKLKPGIEHVAFEVKNYEDFLNKFKKSEFPIDKEVELSGSKFFKTAFINLVEVEFRNDSLLNLS